MINSKQRATLRRMANDLDPLIHLGKGGVTANIISEAERELFDRELVKFAILKSATESPKEICETIAEQIGADVVQVIGRKFVLYKKNEEEPVIKI